MRLSRRALIGGLLASACRRDQSPPLELWFGGDVHVGDDAPRLEGLAPAGVGMVNLEGPVGEAPFAVIEDNTVKLANAAGRMQGLADLGVYVASVSNNHAGDRGGEGKRATEHALGRAGIRPAGVAHVGHTVYCAFDSPNADRSIMHLVKSEVLVVSFHVTGPPSYLPRADLRAAVDDAVKAGARVVVAHGTHALGPVERRGETVIAWGLGNLLFSCACTKEREGLILETRIDGDRTHAKVTPVDAGLMGQPARPAADAKLAFDVLESIGSSKLTRRGRFAEI